MRKTETRETQSQTNLPKLLLVVTSQPQPCGPESKQWNSHISKRGYQKNISQVGIPYSTKSWCFTSDFLPVKDNELLPNLETALHPAKDSSEELDHLMQTHQNKYKNWKILKINSPNVYRIVKFAFAFLVWAVGYVRGTAFVFHYNYISYF